ncbi:trans-2-enoyl-CoA reductase family protein [Clostridium sp. SHJSY1]|uniref:enoyl-ACP reductase FabV n=1 Tax=Clostridium sp. SHJSY1 TaxID=2942483 RepID=UPI0028742FF2|nr:enoyl-ACP reductase FabV [Clostridium sp. SHJSY1]MDS0524816.1 trans-2-enoyl-CoA reductase family protein [Clostridium sp. SHJSY1]
MIIKPRFKDFICITAHPEGCKNNVLTQIDYTLKKGKISGSKKVLVLGASTGYGLASRIVSTFGMNADTIGVVFEKPATNNRPATAGWYNTAAFQEQSRKHGFQSITINGDAFSKETKEKTIESIKNTFGKVDLVIYSIASPRRKDPNSDKVYNSTLKPIGDAYENKTVDFHTKVISNTKIQPATSEEIEETIKVMGGEDWKLWIEALSESNVLADGAKTIAYSYIGPDITHAIYRSGTIGKAKENLEKSAHELNELLSKSNGNAYVAVNKALVTQSSLAIPVLPLYISILNKVMDEKSINEGCIEQMYRLFSDFLYKKDVLLDSKGRIRLDDLEMRNDVQKEVLDIWNQINSDNINDLTDIDGFENEFFNLFGFAISDINYDAEVDLKVEIENLI